MAITLSPSQLSLSPILVGAEVITDDNRSALATAVSNTTSVADFMSALVASSWRAVAFVITDSTKVVVGQVTVTPPSVTGSYPVTFRNTVGSQTRTTYVTLADIDAMIPNLVSGYDERYIYRPNGLIGSDPAIIAAPTASF